VRVLVLADDLLPGGIARHIADVANALVHTDITIFVSATPGKFLSRLDKEVPFLPLGLLTEDSFEKNLFGLLPSYFRLARLIKRERIEIIHSHKRYAHLLGTLLAKQFHIPHITSYHSDIVGKKWFTYFGDYTICCSNAVRELVVNQYGCKQENAKTIYYGIRPFRTHTEAEKEITLKNIGISDNKIIISSVGQFIPVKDKKSLILAVSELRKIRNISNLIFVLLGYGDQKQYLQNLVQDLNLRENIVFLDGLFDVESLFNVSEFMMLNSIREGFGIVLLEAASLGKVHIGTNVGGIPEFIENGKTGILVEKENPAQLAGAIHSFLEDPEKLKLMGREAKRKYETMFGFDHMIIQIVDVYRSIYLENYKQGVKIR